MRNLSIYLLGAFALSYFFLNPASAQMNTCGAAVGQLQDYVARVNQVTQFEMQGGIARRCGGNPYCMQGLYQQLQMWYAQQSNLVNNYYMQISQQCSQQPSRPLPRRHGRDDGPSTIDEDDVSQLDVDDEDKTVKIRIPKTPQGFQPR